MSANQLKRKAEKTELIWAGTMYTVASFLRLHDPTLMLGMNTVKAADAMHVLSILLFTPDLTLENHVKRVSAKCFFNCVACNVHSTANVQLH